MLRPPRSKTRKTSAGGTTSHDGSGSSSGTMLWYRSICGVGSTGASSLAGWPVRVYASPSSGSFSGRMPLL